ncbi:MAG: hypothetical protein C5B47_02765 [Verrucomicrobia bacterium]|nr:MAG: hypothetical protein C5B47_02765 [Verrucomicrobiota bacterium]
MASPCSISRGVTVGIAHQPLFKLVQLGLQISVCTKFLQGVGTILSEHLLPVFNKLSEQLISFVTGKHGEIKKWVEDFGKFVQENVPTWVEEARKFGQEVGDFATKAWKVIEPLRGE